MKVGGRLTIRLGVYRFCSMLRQLILFSCTLASSPLSSCFWSVNVRASAPKSFQPDYFVLIQEEVAEIKEALEDEVNRLLFNSSVIWLCCGHQGLQWSIFSEDLLLSSGVRPWESRPHSWLSCFPRVERGCPYLEVKLEHKHWSLQFIFLGLHLHHTSTIRCLGHFLTFR